MAKIRAASLGQEHKLSRDFCLECSTGSHAEIWVCVKMKKAITASSCAHVLPGALIGILGLGTNITG